tara:strand:- start:2953 stop:3456 length:504 start_codon:yes stop_codon:yes gene_type:complete
MDYFSSIKKYFAAEKKDEYRWISGLILFLDGKEMIVDRGFIITGDVNYYSFYCQFKNFTHINGELYYMYPTCMKKINPEKVHLHLRYGTSPYPVEKENLAYWNLFFTAPNNKIYTNIKLDPAKIKVFDFEKVETKFNIQDVNVPLFETRQAYNTNSVLFTSLKIKDL